ncbi:hypothetical protein F4825DRAFT_443968 [Nemania diffusa]|nr:hypothetical protein F4825DRAFT_443968 [Nemania diffusa]
MSSEATTPPSRRSQTARAIVAAYNTNNLETIMSFRTEDCIQEILPKSLGRPEMDNTAYASWIGPMLPQLRGFTVTIDDLIEDARANKVVILAHSTASTDVGPYANEYVFVFHLNETGDKITRFQEFVDSANSVTFFPKLQEYLEQKAKAEGK